MGEAFLTRRGVGVDISEADAVSKLVLFGQKFFSAGSEDVQTGTMPARQTTSNIATDKRATNTILVVKPPEGYYNPIGSSGNPGLIEGWVQINDSNFIPANIAAGKNVLGHSGTFTSDATASSGNIEQGKFAYVNGNKVDGALVAYSNAEANSLVEGPSDVTAKLFMPLAGRAILYDKSDIAIQKQDIINAIGLTGDKIAKGSRILDVNGTFTSDATATPTEILEGCTAYVNGNKVTGNIVNKFGNDVRVDGAYIEAINEIFMSIVDDSAPIAIDGGTTLIMSGAKIASVIGLIASKLIKGNKVLGIDGTGARKVTGKVTTSTTHRQHSGFVNGTTVSTYETVVNLPFNPTIVLIMNSYMSSRAYTLVYDNYAICFQTNSDGTGLGTYVTFAFAGYYKDSTGVKVPVITPGSGGNKLCDFIAIE